jgi:predicted HNH restriction endonuclease
MATELSKLEWIEILQSPEITNEFDLSIFQGLYSFEKNAAPASEIGKILGYEGKSPQGPLNLEIGRYAKRIAKHYEINFTERNRRKFKFWDLFFNGWDRGNRFVWQLKEEIKEALEDVELTGIEQFPEEINIEDEEILTEGLRKIIMVNTYERNPRARKKCIDHWKAICAVCDFDFSEKYGEIGKGFIHVHHLIPVSEIGEEYEIDPINDLAPVCPNCHSMIHRENPPMSIEDLKKKIGEKKKPATKNV